MPTPEEAEDLVLDLPPADGGLTDDDGLSDLDDEDEDDGLVDDESVGLDVSTGFDQDADLGDLIDDADGEDQRWSDATEAASDLIKIEARDLTDGDEEDGWTEDNEAAGDTVAHRDDQVDDGDLPALGTDSDDEGFGEERAGEEGDDVDLPPMDANEPDVQGTQPDVLDASLLGRLDHVHEPELARIEVQPGVSWAWFPRRQVRSSELGGPVKGDVFHLGPVAWTNVGDALFPLDTPDAAPVRVGGRITQAVADTQGELLVSADSGLWRVTRDTGAIDLGGPSADPAMIANARLAIASSSDSQRQVWAQSKLGSLFVRMTAPDRWSLVDSPRPGHLLASDGRRALAYLHTAARRPVALVRSDDAGASWTSRALELWEASIVTGLLVCRDVVLLVTQSMTTPVLVALGHEAPREMVSGLRAPVALVYEDGEVVLYGCVLTTDRVLLIRQPLGRPVRKPSVVEAWEAAEGVLPTTLSAHHHHGVTDLILRAGQRVLRLRLLIAPDHVA